MPVKLGVLGSGGGTNYQAVQDSCGGCGEGLLCGRAEAVVVISNNSTAGILGRARKAGVSAVHLSSATHPDPHALDAAIRDALVAHGADLVLLAGYMKPVGPLVLQAYHDRVLNIHPALDLARFGGQGFHGLHVHKAVIAAGELESGATVHLADEQYDHGRVIAQSCPVPVLPDDTPDTLAARVLVEEHKLFPWAILCFLMTEFSASIPTAELLR